MGARRVSSVPPPGPPIWLTTGGPYPSAGPQLRSITIGRRAILPPATNVTFQEKTALLVKFNFFHYFKDSANSKQERARCNSPVSVKETCLRENKGVAANAIQALGSGARPRRSRDSPAGRKGPAPSAAACGAGGRARLCLARREAATGHPLPPPPSAVWRPARGRVSESAAIWQRPSGKASPRIGGAPAPPSPPPGAGTQLFSLLRAEERRASVTRPALTGGLQSGAGIELLFFFFFSKRVKISG